MLAALRDTGFISYPGKTFGGEASAMLGNYGRRRVAAAVEIVWQDYAGEGEDIRIDVILLAPGRKPTHIANAWMPFG